MPCDKVCDNFADYLTERLTPARQNELARHIQECSTCAAELQEWTDIWVKMGGLSAAGGSAPAVDKMSARLHRAIEAHKAREEERPIAKYWRFALAGVAAVVGV